MKTNVTVVLDALEWGDVVRRTRGLRGMRRLDVALIAGITVGALSRIENGDRPNPTLSTIIGVCKALGLECHITPAGYIFTAVLVDRRALIARELEQEVA